MSELLYINSVNPPVDVLHHSILYRDRIVSLVPDNFEELISAEAKLAWRENLFEPMSVRNVLNGTGWQPRDISGQEWANHLSVAAEKADGWSAAVPESERDAWDATLRAAGEANERIAKTDIDILTKLWQGGAYFYLRALAARALTLGPNPNLHAQLQVPHFDWKLRGSGGSTAARVTGDHILIQVDAGQLLPDPVPGVDTSALIAFRERYDDERLRLLNAVERLVEQYRQAYENPADIERSVRRDLSEALADMQKAGRDVLNGWSRRIISVVTAAGATATTTMTTGAPAIVTVGASVASGLAINIATNSIPAGRRDDRYKSYHYLYRVQRELDESTR